MRHFLERHPSQRGRRWPSLINVLINVPLKRERGVNPDQGLAAVGPSSFWVPTKTLFFSSCLGWVFAASAAIRGVILGRQLILGESSYRSAIAA